MRSLNIDTIQTKARLFGLAAVLSAAWLTSQVAAAATAPKVSAGLTPYQVQLRDQIDTDGGAPRSGRDPALQAQSGLKAAASQPNGTGTYTDKPAAGLTGAQRHTDPASVLPDPKKTGMLSTGCLLDYGKPGEQCVPAAGTANPAQACMAIKKIFPNGVAVSGTDKLKLDKNADKMACAKGD